MSKIIRLHKCPAWCKERIHNRHEYSVGLQLNPSGGSLKCVPNGFYLYIDNQFNYFELSFESSECVYKKFYE
jgi:hypothetical protein